MVYKNGSRNYIIAKNDKDINKAKECDACGTIINEHNNVIYIHRLIKKKWVEHSYVLFGSKVEQDVDTTGLRAYQAFYSYCGKPEIERMKTVYPPLEMWESFEQMHFFNVHHVDEKIYQPIYEFDVNSSFAYGTLGLPDEFNMFKAYMLELYELKKNAKDKTVRNEYKNLMNFLIGYFARIKAFISVRSEIINNSNENIRAHMLKIIRNGGTCFLSNTDSIVTDKKGAEVMLPLVSNEIGKFKLSSKTDRLYYKSSNAYQLGDKVVYSGVSYFARKHTDFFKDRLASQKGSLIVPYDFDFCIDSDLYNKVCRVKLGQIEVVVYNKLGEILDKIIYKIEK